jgi:hypothetical protein
MINSFIDRGINLQIGDIPGLFSASIQERFEALCDHRTIPGRRNLLRRHSDNADFFVGGDRSAQQLLDSGFHARRQLAGKIAGPTWVLFLGRLCL